MGALTSPFAWLDAFPPDFAPGLRYQIDRWQRVILFLDILRARANDMLEHEAAGMPPLLDFEYETLLDARNFDRPANYALLRITRCHAYRAADCVDPAKHMLYRMVLEPWITAFANSCGATMLKWLHPMRASRLLFSERFNASMLPVEALAGAVREARVVADDTAPFVHAEQAAAALISRTLDGNRQVRDSMYEALFTAVYGTLGRWPCFAMPLFDWPRLR